MIFRVLVISPLGYKYFILCIDQASRYTWIFLLKQKPEVSNIVKQFYNLIETLFGKKIKIFHLDSGGDYVNTNLSNFFQEKNIIHQCACPCTPKQNGVIERKNIHVVETALALLDTSNVPKILGNHLPSLNKIAPILIYSFLKIARTTLILKYLVVYILFFFKIMNVINYPLKLVSVFLWGTMTFKKDICVMIQYAIH